MENKCYYCNKRVIVGGISMCIYDIEEDEYNVHKSREQRIPPSNCERNHRLLNE